MAEPVIAAVEVTVSKAMSIAAKQIILRRGFNQWRMVSRSVAGFDEEIEKLHTSLALTRYLLSDAETRQDRNPAFQFWLERLVEIASEADDVLDELVYEHLRKNVETQIRKKVSNFFSITKNPIVFCFKMPQKVKYINRYFKVIVDSARTFGLQRVNSSPPLSRGSQTIFSFIDSPQVVGREDVSNIINLLISSSIQQNFSVVSIVGMGKTILARSVCCNEQIKNYFDKIMWVCVSEKFDVKRILQEIFESLTGQTCDLKNRTIVLEKIRRELEGNAYLLTIDDVWDEDFKTWEDLKDSLLSNKCTK
ncbi:hypothetical protein DITRI_Ditri15bG0017900 [Diplodiscus trichospermus]